MVIETFLEVDCTKMVDNNFLPQVGGPKKVDIGSIEWHPAQDHIGRTQQHRQDNREEFPKDSFQ